MKTNVIMKRPMGNFEVLQRTSDSFFNATSLFKQWNTEHPKDKRELDNFWKATHLKELMSEIAINEYNFKSVDFTELKNLLSSTKRGKKNGGTWMHPILFIKCAMYINPSFEYQVIKFVYDQLIRYRHDAGDRYNVLTASISKLVGVDYKEVANAINWIVFNRNGKNLRQSATEAQLREISDIENSVSTMIEIGMINDYQNLIETLRKMYNKKYQKF